MNGTQRSGNNFLWHLVSVEMHPILTENRNKNSLQDVSLKFNLAYCVLSPKPCLSNETTTVCICPPSILFIVYRWIIILKLHYPIGEDTLEQVFVLFSPCINKCSTLINHIRFPVYWRLYGRWVVINRDRHDTVLTLPYLLNYLVNVSCIYVFKIIGWIILHKPA